MEETKFSIYYIGTFNSVRKYPLQNLKWWQRNDSFEIYDVVVNFGNYKGSLFCRRSDDWYPMGSGNMVGKHQLGLTAEQKESNILALNQMRARYWSTEVRVKLALAREILGSDIYTHWCQLLGSRPRSF